MFLRFVVPYRHTLPQTPAALRRCVSRLSLGFVLAYQLLEPKVAKAWVITKAVVTDLYAGIRFMH